MGTVVSGAAHANVEGYPKARVGDRISCEAVIQTGSSTAVWKVGQLHGWVMRPATTPL
nr:hypothetical protein [Achromobacter sp. MFA1 R4]